MNIEEEEEDTDTKFRIVDFQRVHFIQPKQFSRELLLSNKNQVAGHAGFYSILGKQHLCLKPFNLDCVRGRREHLFYQLVEFFKSNHDDHGDDKDGKSETYVETYTESKETKLAKKSKPRRRRRLYYKNLELLIYTSPKSKCNCIIDESLIRQLSSFVADFHCVKHISNKNNDDTGLDDSDKLLSSVYSNSLKCPCYGRNPKEKTSCARDYEKINFLCLQDLTAHCIEPCIIDIKIGQITYDPMAIKEKVLEQSSKYRQLREFGFRILGMKLGDEIRGRTFGMTLESSEQVFEALNSFFIPLKDHGYICCAIDKIIIRIESLLEWFEQKNIDQLKFYSSSLLIVYDWKLAKDNLDRLGPERQSVKDRLADSIRVSMIDFAHVFHVHLDQQHQVPTDSNYIFGLRKLLTFLISLRDFHMRALSG